MKIFQKIENSLDLTHALHDKSYRKNLITSSINISKEDYDYCKPKLSELFSVLKLDIIYTEAEGTYLYYEHNNKKIRVTDFVSGYGAALLGHNHPELKEELIYLYKRNVPFLVQGSIRSYASQLAKKLNEILNTSKKYYCNFTNSGTETVEAALKHAYKVKYEELKLKYYKCLSKSKNIINYIEENKNKFSENNLKQLYKEIEEYNNTEFEKIKNNPAIIAIENSFHGKTTSSLKITYNKTLREDYEGLSSMKTIFISPDNFEDLELIKRHNTHYLKSLEIKDNKILIEEIPINNCIAIIFEIIQGEGGINELPHNFLKYLASVHQKIDIPYIIDEIQTGCGRTGSFFAFQQTPLSEINPEYILLSKALGGGLTKIGVTMIREDIYDEEFGLQHTSTFAEDDISCAIALKTIDIITRNNNELLDEISKKGNYLKNQLIKLKEKYNDIIKDIRGKGLMLGIEISDLQNYSPFFRYAGYQGFITLLISSYLLHYYNIRVLSPLSSMFKSSSRFRRKAVIRIQPPATVSYEEIDKLITALNEVFNIIKNNNEYLLIAHIFDKKLEKKERINPLNVDILYPPISEFKNITDRVGFIVHITELKYLLEYYFPSFYYYNFNTQAFVNWWNKICRFLDPSFMHRFLLKINNAKIEVDIIGIPYLPKEMLRIYGGYKIYKDNHHQKILLEELQSKIQDAINYVKLIDSNNKKLRCISLGAFTSIITNNGCDIHDPEVAITTGNVYTTALIYQGILKAIEQKNLYGKELTIAVVGATGNIGSALSIMLTKIADKLILIGKDSSLNTLNRLNEVIKNCMIKIFNSITHKKINNITNLEGLEKYFYNDFSNANFYNNDLLDLDKIIAKTINHERIRVGNYSDLKNADIVAIATNSSDAWLIKPSMVKENSIICCASVPSNLSSAFKDHLDKFYVFDGGYALLPENNIINFVGMPRYGNIYGCLAEALLITLAGYDKSFARGEITYDKIEKILEWAEKFNFKPGKFTLGETLINKINN